MGKRKEHVIEMFRVSICALCRNLKYWRISVALEVGLSKGGGVSKTERNCGSNDMGFIDNKCGEWRSEIMIKNLNILEMKELCEKP